MSLRHRKTSLTLEGWYYVVVTGFILTGALLREVNLLMLLFGLLFGVLLLSWRTVAGTLRRSEVHRRAPPSIQAGDLLVVEIEARNSSRRWASWALAVDDSLQLAAPRRTEPPLAARVLFTEVPAGASRRLVYEGRLPRRGRYQFGPLSVSTGFPLGLVRRTVTIDESAAVTVWPRLGRLAPQWARRRREATTGSHRIERPHGSREGDYHSLRDWRPGDSRRWIHWRTSARKGELMVRQFEQHRHHDLVLLVELWQPASPEPRHLDAVELAVSLAATLVADRCRQGAGRLLLGLASGSPDLTGGPASQVVLREVMQRLAVAEASSADRFPGLVESAFATLRPGTDIVLVSTRPVELADTGRFAAVWRDPQHRDWARQALAIDTSSPDLSVWFEQE